MWCLYLGKVRYWSMSQNTRWTSPSTWTIKSSTLTTPLMRPAPMNLSTSNYLIFPLIKQTVALIVHFLT